MDILLDLIKLNKTTNFNQKKKKKLILRPHGYVSYNMYDSYGAHLYIRRFTSNYNMSFWYRTFVYDTIRFVWYTHHVS